MTRLTLTSGLEAATLPSLPADAAHVGGVSWSVDGVLIGRAYIQSYIDFVFEGEFSTSSVEWVALKDFTLPPPAVDTDTSSPLESVKPISLEEESSPLGRKALLFVDGEEEKANAELCAALVRRGHTHALATVRRYARSQPPLPDGVEEKDLKDICLRWSWTSKMRQSIQRICRQMDDDEDHYVVCSDSMAPKPLSTSDPDPSYCPMISVRRVSMVDVEDVKAEAKVWLDVVDIDAKRNDAEEDPFGTRETVSFTVSVTAKDLQKEVKGKIDEIAHQIFVILSCFT